MTKKLLFLFVPVLLFIAGCSTGGGGDNTETVNITVTAVNGDGADVTILSYNSDGTKKRDEVSGTIQNNEFSTQAKLDKNGGYIVVNITKEGYVDWSKRRDFESPHDININATLTPIQSQSIIPLNNDTITVSSTGKKVIKIALIRRSDGRKIIAAGNQIRALNGIPEFSMEIPRAAIPSEVKALKVGLSSFDPEKDAEKFPGDYVDENGNRLISLGFNFVSIKDENGNPVFRENNPSASQTTTYRITRWIGSSVCDNLQGDFCTGGQNDPQICQSLTQDELNGYNVPFYRYNDITGTWELLGVGTIDLNGDGQIDANDAIGSNFDAVQTCQNNGGINVIIVITNPNFRYCNLDYPVVNLPVELCIIKTFKDTNNQPFTMVNAWLEDDDDNQSFTYSSGGFPDQNGTVRFTTWNIANDGDTTANIVYQYPITAGNQTIFVTKKEQVNLGTPDNCPTIENTIDPTEKPCQVKGTIKYEDGGSPAQNLFVFITDEDTFYTSAMTNNNGYFEATVICETVLNVYTSQTFEPVAEFRADGTVDGNEQSDDAQPETSNYRYVVTLNDIEIEKPEYNLFVFKIGNGTVTSNPAGIDCGSDCDEDYEYGTVVTLTATPANGFLIDDWFGCDSVSQDKTTCTVNMDFHRVVTVRFVSQVKRTLNVNVNGNGTVTSVPVGINCTNNGGQCQAQFDDGAQVALTANPAQGFSFTGWQGDCAPCGAQNICNINMNADKNCTANFSQGANNPPVINQFNANPSSGNAPLTVTFSWNVSDPDGDTLTCYLDIDNDGTSEYTINDCANNTSQAHTYQNAGNYTAKLTVTDNHVHYVSETTTVNVTGQTTTIDMTGVWEGTYTGNDGSSGQICVELQQTNGNLTGDLYVAGQGHAGSVNGTVSEGNVTFGIAGGVQYSGTVDPNNNTASGTYDEDGDEQSDGTWQVTKTDKESCGWISSDIAGDIAEIVGLPFQPSLITEVPILTVENNGNTENDWYAVLVEYAGNNQVVPYMALEKSDRSAVFYVISSAATYLDISQDKTYSGPSTGSFLSNQSYGSTPIYESSCFQTGQGSYKYRVYQGTATVSLSQITLTNVMDSTDTRTFSIPSQDNITIYKVEYLPCP